MYPRKFTIELDKPSNSSNDPVLSKLKQKGGKSWLVKAKLIFKLEIQSIVKVAILAELLGVSQMCLTLQISRSPIREPKIVVRWVESSQHRHSLLNA